MKRFAPAVHYITYTRRQSSRGRHEKQNRPCTPTPFERQSWSQRRGQDACPRKEPQSYRQRARGIANGRREGDSFWERAGARRRTWNSARPAATAAELALRTAEVNAHKPA